MDQDLLRALYSYNAYANQLVLETVAKLTDHEFTRPSSPSHESVRTLLIHIVGAEAYFLKLCQGQPLPPSPTEAPTLAQMQAYWQQHVWDQEEFLKLLDEDGLKRQIRYQIGEHWFQLAVWQLLTQAFVHSTHHRGELSIVLSQLGYPLPTLDIIIPFVKQSGQEWPGK